LEFRRNVNFVPVTFLASWLRDTGFSVKIFPHFCWKHKQSKRMTFFAAILRMVKLVFITLVRRKKRPWNGIAIYCPRKKPKYYADT
jgi:hypothetical protein